MHPLKSLITTVKNAITGKISFPKDFNNSIITMKDQKSFTIFRHVIVGNKELPDHENGFIFIVRFKLSNMSVEKNIRFSRFPIPMFIGLPGFRAKFWCLDKESGYNQGIYQWKTEEDAKNYSESFAFNFMVKRSIPGSVTFDIIPNNNIYNYIKSLPET